MARKPLHDVLCEILGTSSLDENDRCYFCPPANMQLEHPCITYSLSNDVSVFADNIHYKNFQRYTVTVIDEDPDSKIPNKLRSLPYCTSDRNFAIDGLNHFVHALYHSGPRIKEEDDNETEMGSNG